MGCVADQSMRELYLVCFVLNFIYLTFWFQKQSVLMWKEISKQHISKTRKSIKASGMQMCLFSLKLEQEFKLLGKVIDLSLQILSRSNGILRFQEFICVKVWDKGQVDAANGKLTFQQFRERMYSDHSPILKASFLTSIIH